MIDHRRFRALAVTAMDWMLSTDEQRELSAHVGGCLACRAWVAGLERDGEVARHWAKEDAPERTHKAILTSAARPRSSIAVGRRNLAGIVLLALLALLIGALAVTLVGSRPEAPRVTAQPSLPTSGMSSEPPAGDIVASSILLPSAPPSEGSGAGAPGPTWCGDALYCEVTGVTVESGHAWVAVGNGVIEVDTSDLKVIRRVTTGQRTDRLVSSAGSIWVAVNGTGEVIRLSPTDGRVEARITVGGQPTGIAAAAGSIWVGLGGDADHAVVRIDPGTNRIAKVIPVSGHVWGIAGTAAAVWIANRDAGVQRIDPATNAVVATVAGTLGVEWVAVGQTDVWATRRDNDLWRIDSGTNTAGSPFVVHRRPTDLVAGPTTVWVLAAGAELISRIDPATGATLASTAVALTTAPPAGFGAVALDGRDCWVFSYENATLYQIRPLTAAP